MPAAAEIRIGDITDPYAVREAMRGASVVIHMAALRITACAEHGSPFDLLRAAYHLGNRHVPLELQPDRLQLRADQEPADAAHVQLAEVTAAGVAGSAAWEMETLRTTLARIRYFRNEGSFWFLHWTRAAPKSFMSAAARGKIFPAGPSSRGATFEPAEGFLERDGQPDGRREPGDQQVMIEIAMPKIS